jgi:hypothetical protein
MGSTRLRGAHQLSIVEGSSGLSGTMSEYSQCIRPLWMLTAPGTGCRSESDTRSQSAREGALGRASVVAEPRLAYDMGAPTSGIDEFKIAMGDQVELSVTAERIRVRAY